MSQKFEGRGESVMGLTMSSWSSFLYSSKASLIFSFLASAESSASASRSIRASSSSRFLFFPFLFFFLLFLDSVGSSMKSASCSRTWCQHKISEVKSNSPTHHVNRSIVFKFQLLKLPLECTGLVAKVALIIRIDINFFIVIPSWLLIILRGIR